MTLIPYAKQHINESDIAAVTRAMQSYQLTRGEEVKQFEEELAAFTGAKYAVLFSSGTSALSAAYFAGKLTSHDRILTTPNTFIGTVAGALPLTKQIECVDVDPLSGNIDLTQLGEKLNRPSSRGREWIVPVHFAGVAVDMAKLTRLIKKPDTLILEDAAHALGSTYPSGEKVGSCHFSDMTVFSFHPAKQITTGEGGAVLTNSEELFERLKLFRNNGIAPLMNPLEPWAYAVSEVTGNFHMNEIEAALGRSQLLRIDSIVEKRRQLIAHYRTCLPESVRFFSSELDPLTSYHLALIHHQERFALKKKLEEEGILTQVHYVPLYRHPAFPKTREEFPGMESYYKTALSLPLYHELTLGDVERITKVILSFP